MDYSSSNSIFCLIRCIVADASLGHNCASSTYTIRVDAVDLVSSCRLNLASSSFIIFSASLVEVLSRHRIWV